MSHLVDVEVDEVEQLLGDARDPGRLVSGEESAIQPKSFSS